MIFSFLFISKKEAEATRSLPKKGTWAILNNKSPCGGLVRRLTKLYFLWYNKSRGKMKRVINAVLLFVCVVSLLFTISFIFSRFFAFAVPFLLVFMGFFMLYFNRKRLDKLRKKR